jgi:CheY-like chemotaxis protein
MALDLRPDVVVMDLHLPDLDGVEATGQAGSRCSGLGCPRQFVDGGGVAAQLVLEGTQHVLGDAAQAQLLEMLAEDEPQARQIDRASLVRCL